MLWRYYGAANRPSAENLSAMKAGTHMPQQAHINNHVVMRKEQRARYAYAADASVYRTIQAVVNPDKPPPCCLPGGAARAHDAQWRERC